MGLARGCSHFACTEAPGTKTLQPLVLKNAAELGTGFRSTRPEYESPEGALGHVVLGEHEVLALFFFPGYEKCGGHANLGLLVAAQNRPLLFQLKLGEKSEPDPVSRIYLQNRATNC